MVEPNINQIKQRISWDNILLQCEKISVELKPYIKQEIVKTLYGIPRGGSVIAVILSHKLNIPIVETNGINYMTAIVDDISDSGETLDDIYQSFKLRFGVTPVTVVIYNRVTKNNKIQPTIYGQLLENNNWIIYPWENQ